MLNRSHAQASSLYNKLQQKLAKAVMGHQSLVPLTPYIHARYTRWCALDAAGGGWMSDYGVLNLSMTPADADAISKKTLLVNSGPAYLVYATKEHVTSAIRRFLNEDLTESGRVLAECDVLGIEPVTFDQVAHVQKDSGKSRSEKMRELFETTCHNETVVS